MDQLDLRNPDDLATFWARVADVNATPVPILVVGSSAVRTSARARPVVTPAGHRAAFLAGAPARCCRVNAHTPHPFGLNRDRACNGTGMPRQREDDRRVRAA